MKLNFPGTLTNHVEAYIVDFECKTMVERPDVRTLDHKPRRPNFMSNDKINVVEIIQMIVHWLESFKSIDNYLQCRIYHLTATSTYPIK